MTVIRSARETLSSAENNLRQVVRLLAAAQPAELEKARRLLEEQVSFMSTIEISARRDRALPLRDALLRIRALLAKAQHLTNAALEILSRRVSLAGLNAAEPESTIRFEG